LVENNPHEVLFEDIIIEIGAPSGASST